jgi:hypothetical protein
MSNASDKELLKNLNLSDKINSLVVCRFLNEYGRELISFEVDTPKSAIICDEDEISEAELLKDLSFSDEKSTIERERMKRRVGSFLAGTGEVVEPDLPDEDGRGELKKLSRIKNPDEVKKRQLESKEHVDLRRLTNAEETGNSSSEILLVHAPPELFDVSVVSGRNDYSSSRFGKQQAFSEHTHETITIPDIPEIEIKIDSRVQKTITKKLKARWNT